MHLRDATVYRGQAQRLGLLVSGEDQGALWCAMAHWSAEGPVLFPPAHAVSKRKQEVRVERGMWIVDCPCGGAQMACYTDQRVFCPDCLNHNGHERGEWVKTMWPNPNLKAQIEAELLKRPVVNRNWYPEETVEDLVNENLENGWVG